MKKIGGATLLGVLIALGLVYWLGPLNKGAVSLIVLISIGLANVFVSVLGWGFKINKPE